MAYCFESYCCAPERCSNLGTNVVNLSSFHKLCDIHIGYLSSSFLECGYCQSICMIVPLLCPICGFSNNTYVTLCKKLVCKTCTSLSMCCSFSCAYCFTDVNTYQLECGKVLCKSCYYNNSCCENMCWVCRKHGSFLLRECKKVVCDSCYSISGCCEKMCSKCFIHQDFLYQQSGKLICETCHHLHDSNQIYCLCGSSKNLKEYDGSFKCASCLEKIKSTRSDNIDIEIIGENQHNYSSSPEFIKKNIDSDTSSIEDLDEKVNHRCANRFYSLDSKLSEDTCSLCYNKGILKFCSLNHGVCQKCSLKACSMCKIYPECQACNLTIRCINCTKFYCQKCIDLPIHIEKCSSTCEKCGINPSNSRKKCGHILCSHCSYPSGNLCSICDSFHSKCKICFKINQEKIECKDCHQAGCSKCCEKSFCLKCLSQKEKGLLNKILGKITKIRCIMCDKKNSYFVKVFCDHSVCLNCLKLVEMFDFHCVACFSMLEIKFCARCKREYMIIEKKGKYMKPCCNQQIEFDHSWTKKLKNLFT